jgi:hypothetical protein
MKPDLALRKRLYVYYVLLIFSLGLFHYRYYWAPDFVIESDHFITESGAERTITNVAIKRAELIYATYSQFWNIPRHGELPSEKKHRLRIYRTRSDLKRMHPFIGWGEAFYMPPVCYQYISPQERNPYHWMKHEIVHQLHREVSAFKLNQWVDEGLACVFSTSREVDGKIVLGTVDHRTYPIWWLFTLGLSGDMQKDICDKRIMQLKCIITGEGGLDINEEFNLYYIQWYSLVHFLLFGDERRHREAFFRYVLHECPSEKFEDYFGPVTVVEKQWYAHLRDTLCDPDTCRKDTADYPKTK